MTEQKHHRIKKGWLAAAIAAIVLLGAVFTANAATDGAVFDGRLLHGLRLYMNGQEFRLSDYQTDVRSVTNADGDTVVRYDYALPNGSKIQADVAEEYTAFRIDADAADEIRIAADPAAETAEETVNNDK